MNLIIVRACACCAIAMLAGLASAQGNGGSQTSCELQYSTCKQTVKADYQFCKQASQGNCKPTLNKALQRCTSERNRCNTATGNY